MNDPEVPIPKRPQPPAWTDDERHHVEEVVFGEPSEPVEVEAFLVFGGTHPGAWRHTLICYPRFHPRLIFLTGGHKRIGVPHHTWTHGKRAEADVIRERLIEGGIPSERIEYENGSENSLDNVLRIRRAVLCHGISSIALVCRSYAAGRQRRTFIHQVPGVSAGVLAYDTDLNPTDGLLGRHTWSETVSGRSVVWGEYLRIVVYGRRGHLRLDFDVPRGLEQYITGFAG